MMFIQTRVRGWVIGLASTNYMSVSSDWLEKNVKNLVLTYFVHHVLFSNVFFDFQSDALTGLGRLYVLMLNLH